MFAPTTVPLPRPPAGPLKFCADAGGGTTCVPVPVPDSVPPRPEFKAPARCTLGGGGTIAVPVPPMPPAIPATPRCSCIGSRGAGATASDAPMLRSPPLANGPVTVGGGPTTPAAATGAPRCDDNEPTSGAGATTPASGKPPRRAMASPIVAGGPTASARSPGTVSRGCPVAPNGTAGAGAPDAPKLGLPPPPPILMSGADMPPSFPRARSRATRRARDPLAPEPERPPSAARFRAGFRLGRGALLAIVGKVSEGG